MGRLIPYNYGDPDPNPDDDTLEITYGGRIVVFEYKDWWPGPGTDGLRSTPTEWIVTIELSEGGRELARFPKVPWDTRAPRIEYVRKVRGLGREHRHVDFWDRLWNAIAGLFKAGEMPIAGLDLNDSDLRGDLGGTGRTDLGLGSFGLGGGAGASGWFGSLLGSSGSSSGTSPFGPRRSSGGGGGGSGGGGGGGGGGEWRGLFGESLGSGTNPSGTGDPRAGAPGSHGGHPGQQPGGQTETGSNGSIGDRRAGSSVENGSRGTPPSSGGQSPSGKPGGDKQQERKKPAQSGGGNVSHPDPGAMPSGLSRNPLLREAQLRETRFRLGFKDAPLGPSRALRPEGAENPGGSVDTSTFDPNSFDPLAPYVSPAEGYEGRRRFYPPRRNTSDPVKRRYVEALYPDDGPMGPYNEAPPAVDPHAPPPGEGGDPQALVGTVVAFSVGVRSPTTNVVAGGAMRARQRS